MFLDFFHRHLLLYYSFSDCFHAPKISSQLLTDILTVLNQSDIPPTTYNQKNEWQLYEQRVKVYNYRGFPHQNQQKLEYFYFTDFKTLKKTNNGDCVSNRGKDMKKVSKKGGCRDWVKLVRNMITVLAINVWMNAWQLT